MRHFFDKLYFGCYWFITLQDRGIRSFLRPIFLFFGYLLEDIPSIENHIKRKFGMTVTEYFETVMDVSWNNGYMESVKVFYVNYWLGPLFTALGFDIILIIWHICGKSFAFLPLNRFQKGWFIFGLSFLFMHVVIYFMYRKGHRDDKITKEYLKKDNHQKRNALLIYIASNVIVLLALVELLSGYFGILNLFGW